MQERPQNRTTAVLCGALVVAVGSCAFLFFHEPGTPVTPTNERPVLSSIPATTTPSTVVNIPGGPEPVGPEAVRLELMPVLWPKKHEVRPDSDGCYKTSEKTAENPPANESLAEPPTSVPPTGDAPVGTVQRGFPCGAGSMRWRVKTGEIVTGSAAFYKDTAIIGGHDGSLYSVRLSDGKIVWKSPKHAVLHTTPVIEDGVLYIGDGYGDMLSMNAATGATLWEYQHDGGGVFSSSPVLYKDMVISGGGGSRVRAWKKKTGELVWEYKTEMWVQADVSVKDGVVYSGSDDGWLHAINADTGKPVWKFPALLPEATDDRLDKDLSITPAERRANILGKPMFHGDLVIITSVGGAVYGVERETGKKVWQQNLERTMGTATVEGGVVFVHTDAGLLRGLDAETGDVLWKANTSSTKNAWTSPYQSISAASVDGESVLVGGREGDLTSYEKKTGKYQWSFRAGLWIRSTPAVADGVVVFGSDDGWIYAVNTK